MIVMDNHDDDNHRSIDGDNDGSNDKVDNNDDVNYAFNNFVNYDVKKKKVIMMIWQQIFRSLYTYGLI